MFPSLAPAVTGLPNQALPEVGLQRVPRPGIKTCITSHRELRCSVPWKSPAGFALPATQGAHKPPSSPCCSHSLSGHPGELSSLSARRVQRKVNLPDSYSSNPAQGCTHQLQLLVLVVLAGAAVCALHGHQRLRPGVLIHSAVAGDFS